MIRVYLFIVNKKERRRRKKASMLEKIITRARYIFRVI
jgi:hypothetical protein